MKREIEQRPGGHVSHAANNDSEVLVPVKRAHSFISFRYSFRSVSSIGGRTHIKAKEKSFENGKFQSEEFEGVVDGNVYSHMAGEMEKGFWGQLASFFKPFGLIGKGKK